MTDVNIHELQRTLNAFTNHWLSGVAPLRVDGEKGHATNSRILRVKYYLGYGKDRDSEVTSAFIRRVRHPRDSKYFPKGMIGTGIKRRLDQRRRYLANQVAGFFTSGVGYFDGRTVAKHFIPYLKYARAHGWQGTLNSGWRSPAYSESLCRAMCGAPTCPGRCAGRGSAHSQSVAPYGAIDVSDYWKFADIMRSMPLPPGAARIYNDLPIDRVHFSYNGH